MVTHHLNKSQTDFILKWLTTNAERPGPGAFQTTLRKIKKLRVALDPPISALKAVKGCDTPGVFLPTSRFDAVRHLPPGWAIVKLHNVGYELENAGASMLATLWNHWAARPDSPFSLREGVLGQAIAKQFAANGVTHFSPPCQ